MRDGNLLLEAIVASNNSVALKFLELKMDPNLSTVGKQKPLTVAAINGNDALIEALLLFGADATFRESNAATALHFAASNVDAAAALRCSALLLEKGKSDIMARSKGTKCAPLHAAVLANSVHVVNLLLNWEDGHTMVSSKCMCE